MDRRRTVVTLAAATLLVSLPLVPAWSIADQGWIKTSQQTGGGKWVLTDEHGREMLFRGVNVCLSANRPAGDERPVNKAEYTGKCPKNNPTKWTNPPLCGVDAGKGKYAQSIHPAAGNDLAQIRALGFDLVRVTVSWSLLEPSPMAYSDEYLDRIAQVVSWAGEQDIRVLLDMHQDWYSYSLNDGSRIGSYVGMRARARCISVCLSACLPACLPASLPA